MFSSSIFFQLIFVVDILLYSRSHTNYITYGQDHWDVQKHWSIHTVTIFNKMSMEILNQFIIFLFFFLISKYENIVLAQRNIMITLAQWGESLRNDINLKNNYNLSLVSRLYIMLISWIHRGCGFFFMLNRINNLSVVCDHTPQYWMKKNVKNISNKTKKNFFINCGNATLL